MDKLNKNTYIIASIAFVLILAAIYFLFIFQKKPKELDTETPIGEIKKLEETPLAKRPFVTLTPTSDGAEIIISVENMSEFDRAEYELTYLADNPQIAGEKIERGTTGTDVNTKEKYKKSLLLGTGSRGVRNPDKGITDGKLTLHMFKGDTEFQSETKWERLEEGLTAQTIADSSGQFKINLPALGKNYWIILTETIGVPKGFEFKIEDVILPVYGSFAVAPNFPRSAQVKINAKSDVDLNLYSYNLQSDKWQKLESEFDKTNSLITAPISSFATFIVTK